MKKILLLLMMVLMLALVAGCGSSEPTVYSEEDLSELGFVTTKDGEFILSNDIFRFGGTNNYYLNYKDEAMIKDAIDDAYQMDLKVIRMWAYLDGMGDSMVSNNAYMQTEAGVFDQIPEGARNGFEAMDYAIKCADEAGIKLVLVLTNNWDAFGGVNQYVKWSETAESHDDFYTDAACKTMYKDYVNHIINRENSYTGIVYKNDPTIMTWELMNEPRAESAQSSDLIYDWAVEMSAYVKELDPNHLVALGDEGFFYREDADASEWAYNGNAGVDFERNLAIETIDYGTFHLYPEHWGETFEDAVKDGNKWIEEHAKVANAVGKPVVLEEYGIQKTGGMHRDYIYESWLNTAEEVAINGTMFWILTGIDTGDSKDDEGLYTDYDGFRVLNDGGRTATLLSDHAKRMAGEDIAKDGHIYIESPMELSKLKEVVALKGRVVLNGKELENITVEIGGIDGVMEASRKGVLVLDTLALGYNGETAIKMSANFADGSTSVDEILVTIDNKATEIVVGESYTFDDDTMGFNMEGVYMAEFGPEGVSNKNGMLKIDTIIDGTGDWQELRVVNKKMPDLAEFIRAEYDMYYLTSGIKNEGLSNPYIIANPGWIKLGQDINKTSIMDLEDVQIDGIDYKKHHVVIEIGGFISAGELYVGIVTANLEYSGEVLIDNLELYKEVYID